MRQINTKVEFYGEGTRQGSFPCHTWQRGGPRMRQDKTMQDEGDDPFLRPRSSPLPSLSTHIFASISRCSPQLEKYQIL